MRLRTHILTSALLAIALYPRTPRKAALLLAGGVLLDVDHYLLYALRSGNWNPLSALRYDRWRNQPIAANDRQRRYGLKLCVAACCVPPVIYPSLKDLGFLSQRPVPITSIGLTWSPQAFCVSA
jgi:hypothetical protein